MIQISIFVLVPNLSTEECQLLKMPMATAQIYVDLILLSDGTNRTTAKN